MSLYTTLTMASEALRRNVIRTGLTTLGIIIGVAAVIVMMAIGDGANDSLMVAAAGLGVGYRPKPALAAVADAVLLHHDLDALLWALGIPRSEWVVRD